MNKILDKLILTALTAACATGTAVAATAPVDAALVQRGEYLARAGDCIACHTAKDGKPFAGGLTFGTPIGAIYSTNITPDADTGIGAWTLDEFGRAVRAGVRKNGDTLYPAMPYPSYANLTDDDVKALYTYFMHGVAPVQQKNRAVDAVWPLQMRWPLSLWRWMFAPAPKPFSNASYPDPQLARGAYLVQGLGHCGACHTPRAATMQERALSDADGLDYLAGGAPIDGWVPTSLRGETRTGLGTWKTEDIVQFLRTGRNAHTAAFGGMTDVVAHSTQHMSDSDLDAIARYLKTLPPKAQGETPYVYDAKIATALRNGNAGAIGAAVYRDNCMACHRSDGRGYTRVFPALSGNPIVQSADPTSLIHVVLDGSTLAGTHTAPSTFTMPPFGWRLSDQEVADVSTFVRNSWGNNSAPVTAKQVAAVRKNVPARAPAPPPGASWATTAADR